MSEEEDDAPLSFASTLVGLPGEEPGKMEHLDVLLMPVSLDHKGVQLAPEISPTALAKPEDVVERVLTSCFIVLLELWSRGFSLGSNCEHEVDGPVGDGTPSFQVRIGLLGKILLSLRPPASNFQVIASTVRPRAFLVFFAISCTDNVCHANVHVDLLKAVRSFRPQIRTAIFPSFLAQDRCLTLRRPRWASAIIPASSTAASTAMRATCLRRPSLASARAVASPVTARLLVS
jgi:hypothetical protein